MYNLTPDVCASETMQDLSRHQIISCLKLLSDVGTQSTSQKHNRNPKRIKQLLPSHVSNYLEAVVFMSICEKTGTNIKIDNVQCSLLEIYSSL